MHLVIDQGRCQGHALCSAAAPELISLRGEDGHAMVTQTDVPAELVQSAERAVAGCPERALSLESDR
jgi:ferredoxin